MRIKVLIEAMTTVYYAERRGDKKYKRVVNSTRNLWVEDTLPTNLRHENWWLLWDQAEQRGFEVYWYHPRKAIIAFVNGR